MKKQSYVELYQKHLEHRHLSKNTITPIMRFLNFFNTWLEGKNWREVSYEDIANYQIALCKRKTESGKTISIHYQNYQMREIASFFAFLKARGKILINPCIQLGELSSPKRLPKNALTAAQVMRLLQQPDLLEPTGFRDRALFELLYSTGLRGNEACKLTVYDIDLEAGFVRVNQGKGRKDRIVPVGKVAISYVREYMERVRSLLLARANGKSVATLFLSKVGTPIRSQVLWAIFRHYREAANLPENFSTHSLRHACATEMLKGGASVRHVQEMLGHSNINTTQIYTHIMPHELKQVHARTAPSEKRRKVEVVRFTKTG